MISFFPWVVAERVFEVGIVNLVFGVVFWVFFLPFFYS